MRPRATVVPDEKAPDVSLVVPLFNEAEGLRQLHAQIRACTEAAGLTCEVIFVDDGSTDGSLDILRALHAIDGRVKAISFQRNYGKAAALSVGFAHAMGTAVVTLDADLQDDPAEIPKLLDRLGDGADVVSGWKRDRRDRLSRRLASRLFNAVVGATFGLRIHDVNCGFKAYRGAVARALAPSVHGDLHRYIPVIAKWRGFDVREVEVNHRRRPYGSSKYGPWRFFAGFFDLLTVWFLQSFVRRPLHLFGLAGLACLAAGGGILGYFVFEWAMGAPLRVRPLILVGLGLSLAGIQFFSLGLLAELVAQGLRDSPDYEIKEVIG